MQLNNKAIAYQQTGYFNTLVTDYIEEKKTLQPFFSHSVNKVGIGAAIKKRKLFATDRQLLVEVLHQQYQSINITASQQENIQLLNNDNTFTITTAHQPNIFTGQLYFVYKILHTIKLAAFCKKEFPESNFVPVYYMGSEDADLDELGHIFIKGEKYQWNTPQTGAVGRMLVDVALIELMNTIEGQLMVQPFGEEIITIVKNCYQIGTTIEQATFKLVNALFANYGLLVILPDNAMLKKSFTEVIKKELLQMFSHPLVTATSDALAKNYKVQASGRDLNLFYLKDNSRERIEKNNQHWEIANTSIKFTETEILDELKNFPERFSPNVILRPLFQEMILPNIIFVGGGGEVAYWLQLKAVFDAVGIPYPMMVLRNSFLIAQKKQITQAHEMGFTTTDLFKNELTLINEIVKKESSLQLNLTNEKKVLTDFYAHLQTTVSNIDLTLTKHVQALQAKAINKLSAIEKKMLRKEKKKFTTQQLRLNKIKSELFPNNNLQERTENLLLFYAKCGKEFIEKLYENSLDIQQQFTILEELTN
jgi:bacillithiol synthase